MEPERLLGPMLSSGWIAPEISGDHRGAVERAGPGFRRKLIGAESRFKATPALRRMSAHDPEPP